MGPEVSYSIVDRTDRRLGRRTYTGYHKYLIRRLIDLDRRLRELPEAFRDHPIGHLAQAGFDATVAECRAAGLSSEVDRILRRSHAIASA